jgi:electron transfer flavoprotein alpha subunit
VSKVIDLADLGDRLVGPAAAAALEQEIANASAQAVFLPASCDGREIAGRLSVRIDRPVIANVVGLELDPAGLISLQGVFGGTEVVRSRFTGAGPGIFVIRAKSFPAFQRSGSPPQVSTVHLAPSGPSDGARVLHRHGEGSGGPSLDEAKVVVSGGRGLGQAERFALIEELAGLLGGAAGATRAIVDAGWAPYACQVGQTGKTVKPEVYLAFGISGAAQHLVGMRGSRHVIAINKDPEAPLLRMADLGVVGDVQDILPKLIEAIRARK